MFGKQTNIVTQPTSKRHPPPAGPTEHADESTVPPRPNAYLAAETYAGRIPTGRSPTNRLGRTSRCDELLLLEPLCPNPGRSSTRSAQAHDARSGQPQSGPDALGRRGTSPDSGPSRCVPRDAPRRGGAPASNHAGPHPPMVIGIAPLHRQGTLPFLLRFRSVPSPVAFPHLAGIYAGEQTSLFGCAGDLLNTRR